MDIIKILAPLGLRKVFYPSSIFVNKIPTNLREYSLAKHLGENMCDLIQNCTKLEIYKPRLPKLSTDQTSSIFIGDAQDPFSILYKRNKENILKV